MFWVEILAESREKQRWTHMIWEEPCSFVPPFLYDGNWKILFGRRWKTHLEHVVWFRSSQSYGHQHGTNQSHWDKFRGTSFGHVWSCDTLLASQVLFVTIFFSICSLVHTTICCVYIIIIIIIIVTIIITIIIIVINKTIKQNNNNKYK